MKNLFLNLNLKNIDNFINLKVSDWHVIGEDIFETIDLFFDSFGFFK